MSLNASRRGFMGQFGSGITLGALAGFSEAALSMPKTQLGAGKPPEDRPRKPVGRKALKVIRTRETPNPKALQFVVNAEILEHGYRSFTTKEDSAGDALATALLNYDEVKTVYVMKNFVTVTMEGLDD